MGLLVKGIELAKDMQMAIVRVGVSLIEKKDIKLANSFRYCIIENSYLKDIALFQYPLALHKLALFIMSAYKVSQSFASLLVQIRKVEGETIRHLSEERVSENNSRRCSHGFLQGPVRHKQKVSAYPITILVPSARDLDKQPKTLT